MHYRCYNVAEPSTNEWLYEWNKTQYTPKDPAPFLSADEAAAKIAAVAADGGDVAAVNMELAATLQTVNKVRLDCYAARHYFLGFTYHFFLELFFFLVFFGLVEWIECAASVKQ